jgi:hypothetical protein
MSIGVLAGKSRSIHAWRELAAFLYLPADVIWLSGWYYLLTGVTNSQPMTGIYLIFMMVSLMAYLILRLLFAWQAPIVLRLGLGALGLVLALWLGENLLVYRTLLLDFHKILTDIWVSFSGSRSLSAEFWSLAGIIFIWVRTVLYTRYPVTQDTIMGRFQFGLFMMLILILIYDRLVLTVLFTGLCIYLMLGLSSLGLARIADINLHRGGRRLRFTLDWFLILSGISTGLVLIAIVVSVLTTTWLSLAIVAVTNGILVVVRYIVENVVVPLVQIILALLYKLLELFYHPEEQVQVQKLNLDYLDLLKDDLSLELEDPIVEVLKVTQPYLLGILLALAAVVILVMLLRLPLKEWLGDAEHANEKTEGNIWKQLRKSINRRIQNVLDRVSKRVNIRRAIGYFRAARIRWIYHQFELYTSGKGYPRPLAATPMEYQSIAARLYTGGIDDLASLTTAYQSIRYGELPETALEVTQVSDAWNRLKHMKKVRPARRQKP